MLGLGADHQGCVWDTPYLTTSMVITSLNPKHKKTDKSRLSVIREVVPVGKASLLRSTAPPSFSSRQGSRDWVLIIRDVHMTTLNVMTYPKPQTQKNRHKSV
jgi:hypothetical protein